ncbi:MAG: DUF1326 domain-containing protein [Candidatus Hydrogenedentes bacterium]|nr:DUF1326 domain-containing protein [Candidatus Hydrogenedentota bacterium]
MRALSFLVITCLSVLPVFAETPAPTITGKYLEVRSCDVFTGPCFANAEVGQSGREAILTWVVDHGTWNEVALDGLKVIAVVRADRTLGNVQDEGCRADSILIVDEKATAVQRDTLVAMAKTLGGRVVCNVADVQTSAIEANLGTCAKQGCASVKTDELEVSTRCLGDKDHVCGNETAYYPPLTDVKDALPAFTTLSSFKGQGLEATWNDFDRRSAFLATFER